MYETPTYIKGLVVPRGKKPPASRKLWSIDLERVWLPFFHATNAMGDTAIPSEALGAPIRLALNKDGSVRFRDNGTPVTRITKPISDMVRLVRDEFVAGLVAHANAVATEFPEKYEAEVSKSVEAGKPIIAHDTAMLLEAQLKREAEAKPATPAPTPEAEKVPEMVTA